MRSSIRHLAVISILLIPVFIGAAGSIMLSSAGQYNDIWLDESNSVYLAGLSPVQLIDALTQDSSPPIYPFLLGRWTDIFGIGFHSIKGFSLIFHLAGLTALFFLGRMIGGVRQGFITSFLYAVSPLAIMHGQNVRMYSMLSFIGTVSTILFLKLFYFNSGSNKAYIGYIAVNIFGSFLHYWFFFLLAAHAAGIIVTDCRKTGLRKFLKAIMVSVIPFAILWSPIMASQIRNNHVSYLVKPGLEELSESWFWFFSDQQWSILGVFIIISCLITFFKKKSIQSAVIVNRTNLLLIIFFTINWLTPVLISQKMKCYFAGRYEITVAVFLCLILGNILARINSKIMTAAFCLIMTVSVYTTFLQESLKPYPFSSSKAATHLMRNAREGDIIIFGSLSRSSVDYYFRVNGMEGKFVEMSFPEDIDRHPSGRDVMLYDDPSYQKLLEEEAGALIVRLKHRLKENPEARIWLLRGNDPVPGSIIQDMLMLHFALLDTLEFSGTFFTGILIFG